jgi:hypothetical protein
MEFQDSRQSEWKAEGAVTTCASQLAGSDPGLVGDNSNHEEEVDAEGPDDEELTALEVAARDGGLFGFD